MTEVLKRHALGLFVCPAQHSATDLFSLISGSLERFGPIPSKGPQTFIAVDLTERSREVAWKAIRRNNSLNNLKDRKTVRSAIHTWCSENNITLFDPQTKSLKDESLWKPGLYANITDTGIGRVFEVKKRKHLFSSWKIGGLWSGFLRINDDAPDDCIETPWFNDSAWDESSDNFALNVAGNCDIACLEHIVWPVQHNAGPKHCVIKKLAQRFKANELKTNHVEPWCVIVNSELITPDNWNDTANAKLNFGKPKNWNQFTCNLFQEIKDKTIGQHTIVVLDLELAN